MNKIFANHHLDIPRPTVSFTSSIPPFKINGSYHLPFSAHQRWGSQSNFPGHPGPICAPCSNTWILWMTGSLGFLELWIFPSPKDPFLNDHSYTKFNNLGLSYYKFTSRSEIHNSTRFLSLVCFCGNVKKFSSCWGLSSCIQGSCFTILEMMMLMVSSDRSSGFCRCFNSIGRLIRQ